MKKTTCPATLKQRTTDTLAARDLAALKKFGQNFLVDETILSEIAEIADVRGKDTVLEIGPGLGALTKVLSERAGQVIAVEIDTGMVRTLRETFPEGGNVTIIEGDILQQDIPTLLTGHGEASSCKVVANLPYYITTPVLLHLFHTKDALSSFTVMVQKEVADRMCASPGSKTYGALSLAVQYYTDARVALRVPPSAFYPRPKVESAVVHLTRHEAPPVTASDEDTFFRLIRAAFSQRRKTFVNSVSDAWSSIFPEQSHRSRDDAKALLKGALTAVKKPETARAETLSLEDFIEMLKRLSQSD